MRFQGVYEVPDGPYVEGKLIQERDDVLAGVSFWLNPEVLRSRFMARPLRIEIENGLYHVTSRGWERREIVKSDQDREDWLRLFDRVATRSNWRV